MVAIDTLHTVWQPVEITLTSDYQVENPYTDITLTATFEHESGEEHTVPGFWDGDTTWRVRFAPTRPGEWTWQTESDLEDFGLVDEGEFVAASYEGSNPIRKHGFLRVADSDRHLEHADGTPFFWLADTVWSASAKATLEEWRAYLTKRRSQEFSVVQLNSLPQWDASKPQRRLPFGERWDFDSPRPSYFRELDSLIAEANAHGIVPALVVLWFNYVPETNLDWDGQEQIPRHPMTERQAAQYGRYMAARYGAYGAVWLISGDSDFNKRSLTVYRAAGESIQNAATHPLSTLHIPGGDHISEEANAEPWLDFQMYQSGHHFGEQQREAFRTAEYTRDLNPERPVLNGEPCYEQYAYFENPEIRISREDVRRAAWWSILSGASAGITYGAPGLWHWYRSGERIVREDMPIPYGLNEMVELPGAADYVILKTFLEQFEFGKLTPAQSLVVNHDATVRAATLPKEQITLIYTPERQPLNVDTDQLAVDDVEWLDPATDRRVPASNNDGQISAPPWYGDSVAIIR